MALTNLVNYKVIKSILIVTLITSIFLLKCYYDALRRIYFGYKTLTIKSESSFRSEHSRIQNIQLFNKSSQTRWTANKDDPQYLKKKTDIIKIALVLCGDRLLQTIMVIKSALAISNSDLHFIIMADDDNRNKFIQTLRPELTDEIFQKFSFQLHPITFPIKNSQKWRQLFKPCASQRLFLPNLLSDVDSIIYVDTDILFLSPVENIWQYFYKMNENQIAGMAKENEDFATGWYNRFARHPFVEPLGVNSGVMLMNLTRMRNYNWDQYLEPIYDKYRLNIVWGDQDIINILFHNITDKLLILPCEYNYRPDHCIYSRVCKTAEQNGVKIIHGNRGVFLNSKLPAFRAVYQAYNTYALGTDLKKNLLLPMKRMLQLTSNTNCGKTYETITKGLEKAIS